MTTTKSPRKARIPNDHGAAKREQVSQQFSQWKLLGECVSWCLRENRGTTNTYNQTVLALQQAGLDDKIAKKLLPTQAFSRACNRLKSERLIDVIRDDKDDILFQFSRRQLADDLTDGNKMMSYPVETKVLLNKTTGDLTCKDAGVLEEAKKQLDRCLEERTTSDISTIVTRLFEAHGDLIPIGVGVFFVPQEHVVFTDKIHSFLKLLNRKMTRFPVPAGTPNGDKSVQEAMADHFKGMMEDLRDTVKGFSLSTRQGTVEGVAEKYNTINTKIEAYEAYLGDTIQELKEARQQGLAELVAQIEGLEEERKTAPEGEKGSMRQRVAAVLDDTPRTVKQLCELAGTNTNGIGVFLDGLVDKGKALKVGGGYVKAKE